MPTVELTKDNFEETIAGNDIVFVDFWAEWCGPCRSFGPVFERVSDANPDITFGKVDTEAQQELASAFNIMSIPTLMALRDSVVLYAQPGALPETSLSELVQRVRDVDMQQVQAELASQNQTDQRAEATE